MTRLSGGQAGPTVGFDDAEAVTRIGDLWWLRLVIGVAWCIAALVILQFDGASVKTVGVLVGIMFLAAGCQEFLLVAIGERVRWLGYVFGALFVVAGFVALFNPEDTFEGVADILGFLFLTVGVYWTIEAFVVRATNSLWWVGLIAGLMMLVLAFWTSGQFFIHKAYVLLVFAGIWALLQGVTEIVRAFRLR
jgi:uncharacterized membrane protein HdeD (DUF308 family)